MDLLDRNFSLAPDGQHGTRFFAWQSALRTAYVSSNMVANLRKVSYCSPPGTWSRTAHAIRSQVVSYFAAGRSPNRAQKSSIPHSGWPSSSTSKRWTTSALPSRDTSVFALRRTFPTTCIQRYSLRAANGSRPDDPLMMCRLVNRVAFGWRSRLALISTDVSLEPSSVSRNLGRMPDTPLVACSRTSSANACSELSPWSRSATSIGFGGSASTAPGTSTYCRLFQEVDLYINFMVARLTSQRDKRRPIPCDHYFIKRLA
jgi:hypothetical protein